MGEIKPLTSVNNEPKKDEKKVEKVISGSVKRKEQSLAKKFSDTFFEEDAESVKNYIFTDVIIPAIKETFRDVVMNTLEMFLFGQVKGSNTKRIGGTSIVNYNSISRSNSSVRSRTTLDRNRSSHNFDDIIFETRGEAEQVLSALVDLTVDYGEATVADFYTLVGDVPNFTDDNWGWKDLSSASVRRIREGYIISLPRTLALNVR